MIAQKLAVPSQGVGSPPREKASGGVGGKEGGQGLRVAAPHGTRTLPPPGYGLSWASFRLRSGRGRTLRGPAIGPGSWREFWACGSLPAGFHEEKEMRTLYYWGDQS